MPLCVSHAFPNLRSVARVTAILVLFQFLLFVPPVSAAEAEDHSVPLKYTLGFEYSTGSYGLAQKTQIYFVPISIEADFYPVTVNVTVPFLLIDGPSGVAVDNFNAAGNVTNAGLGEISGRVSYLISPFFKAAPWFEVSARLRAPSESPAALGSGEWAFSLQGDVFKQVGRVTGFADVGRTFYSGRIEDRLFASVGTTFRFTDRVSGGMSYDWFESSFAGVSDSHDLAGFASLKASERWSLGPYATLGLSAGSPDFAVGVSFSFRPPNP